MDAVMNGTKALIRSGVCLGQKSQGICENASSDDFWVTLAFVIACIVVALCFFYKRRLDQKPKKEEARKKEEESRAKEARHQRLIQAAVASVLSDKVYKSQIPKMTQDEYKAEKEHITDYFANAESSYEILKVEKLLKESFSPAKELAGRFPK